MAKSKVRVRYTARAEADLDRVAVFTAERWGEGQVEPHLRALIDMAEHLAVPPRLGFPLAGRRELQFPIAEHVIYFRRAPGGGIDVTRIMHGAQHRRR